MLEVIFQRLKHQIMDYYIMMMDKEENKNTLVDSKIFIHMEEHYKDLRRQLNEVIHDKIMCLETMKQQISDFNHLESLSFSVTNKIDKLEKHIEQFVADYPLPRNQNVMIFFKAEVQNNWRGASSLSRQHSI